MMASLRASRSVRSSVMMFPVSALSPRTVNIFHLPARPHRRYFFSDSRASRFSRARQRPEPSSGQSPEQKRASASSHTCIFLRARGCMPRARRKESAMARDRIVVPIKSAMVPQTMANQTVAISKADEKPGLSHSATKSADEFGQAYHDARLAFRHFDAEWTGALAATEDDERNALATLARFCVIADRHADRRLKWLNEQGVKPHAGAKSRYHVITKAMVFSAAKGSRRDIMRRLGQRLTKFAGAIDQAAAMAHGDPDRSEEHTSELQSPDHIVCRLLLEKNNSRERSGINTILHELNTLFTINVTMRDIKSKNVYSRVIFFFNDTATTEIYTLSLHDALPISSGSG